MHSCRTNVVVWGLVGLLTTMSAGGARAEDDLSDWDPLPQEGGRSFVIVPILFPEEDDGLQASIWEDLPLYIPGSNDTDGPNDGVIESDHGTMTEDDFKAMCESRPGRHFEVAVDGRWVCCKVDWGCYVCNAAMDCEIDCASAECELEFGSDYQGPHFDNPAAADACQKDGDGDGYADGVYSEFADGGWSCCDLDYGCLECHPGDGCEMMCFSDECHDNMAGNTGQSQQSGDGPGKRYRRMNHAHSRQ